jgi:hypothetical protein
MASLPAEALSPRSRLIMLYALCGFANFGSLGIMIGGLCAMAPSRRAEIMSLGPRIDHVGNPGDVPARGDRGHVDLRLESGRMDALDRAG